MFSKQSTQSSTEALAQLGDRVLLSYIVLSAIAAVALGVQFVDSGLAIAATVLLLAIDHRLPIERLRLPRHTGG